MGSKQSGPVLPIFIWHLLPLPWGSTVNFWGSFQVYIEKHMFEFPIPDTTCTLETSSSVKHDRLSRYTQRPCKQRREQIFIWKNIAFFNICKSLVLPRLVTQHVIYLIYRSKGCTLVEVPQLVYTLLMCKLVMSVE